MLKTSLAGGARFAPIGDVDALVQNGQAGLFLKHDVHAVNLESLAAFAASQRDLGIAGSYFFMAPDHPLTASTYSFPDQVKAMHSVAALGHQIGLHLDPYFVMHHSGKPLREILAEILQRFATAGINLTVGNMHGNSRFKMPDQDGFGTMFDLFDEIARQPDFPELANVPDATAGIIRRNRVRLRDFGFNHWADMPMWSAAHGLIATNFITDNQLMKRGTLEVLVQADTIGQYKLVDRQPPGSRSFAPARGAVPCMERASAISPTSDHVRFESDSCADWFSRLALQPTLVLLHPEHYC